jgi:MFS family permease
MFGMAILATAIAPAMLYLGCGLFGLGVGNTTSLPGLLVQQTFPKQHFARIVSLVVAINQFSFAFGPTLLGQLEQAGGIGALDRDNADGSPPVLRKFADRRVGAVKPVICAGVDALTRVLAFLARFLQN